MMTRTTLIGLVMSASALGAQQQTLVGTWEVSFPAGARVVNGQATAIMATGLFTVTAQRDSLIANLAANPSPGQPARPPTRLAASATSAGEIVFESRTERTISVNGSERTAVVLSTWRVAVRNDSLTGTVERKIEGNDMGNSGPQPLTGVRVKR